MPGYLVKHERIAIDGAADLHIRSLLDRQQFADPLGEAAAAGISPSHWPLFGLVWPAGLRLAGHMARRPLVAGERVLEIGCGIALASLVCHRRGIDITASDAHPLARDFLGQNTLLNDMAPLAYRHGPWGLGTPDVHGPNVSGLFDLLIGSDVLYERDVTGLLPGFIGRHARPAAEVLIIDPRRGNRPAFTRQMRALGFHMHDDIQLEPIADDGFRGRLLSYRRTLN